RRVTPALLLAAAALAGVSLPALAAPPKKAKPAAEPAPKTVPADPKEGGTQPPDGKWLVDKEGRQYFARKLAKEGMRFLRKPDSGQWRDGFDIADMNGDGHLDIVHSAARKTLTPPVIFLGDGKVHWRRWSEARYPRLNWDYGDAAVGDFNGDGHPDIALGVHL